MNRFIINILLIGILLAGWCLWPFVQYYAAYTRLNDLRYEESIHSFDKAINSKRLDRDRLHKSYYGRAEARLGLAVQTRAEDSLINDAIKDYSIAINMHSKDPFYFRNRGSAYSYLGAYDEAFADFAAIRNLEGDAPMWSLVRKGGLLRQLGNYDEAHEAFQTVLDIWKRPLMPPYYHMALTYKEQGRHDQVIEAINSGMAAQTDYGSAFKERACAKAKVGRVIEAIDDYQRGIELDYMWSKNVNTDFPSFRHNKRIEKTEIETLQLLERGEVSRDNVKVQNLCKQTWWHLYFNKKRERSPVLALNATK